MGSGSREAPTGGDVQATSEKKYPPTRSTTSQTEEEEVRFNDFALNIYRDLTIELMDFSV